jgi:uncharacterized protein
MSSIYLAGLGVLQADTTVDYPRTDRLAKGNPKRQTQALYKQGSLSCGIWQCEVGAWNIQFPDNRQEFFSVLEGVVRIHDAQTQQYIEVKAGEAGIIPASFLGMFEVIEPVKKHYVLVDV